jgi:hypothetical protein
MGLANIAQAVQIAPRVKERGNGFSFIGFISLVGSLSGWVQDSRFDDENVKELS